MSKSNVQNIKTDNSNRENKFEKPDTKNDKIPRKIGQFPQGPRGQPLNYVQYQSGSSPRGQWNNPDRFVTKNPNPGRIEMGNNSTRNKPEGAGKNDFKGGHRGQSSRSSLPGGQRNQGTSTGLKSGRNSEGDDISTAFNKLSIGSPSQIDIPQNVLYFGWFFDETVSGSIKAIAYRYFQECLNEIPNFRRFILKSCKDEGIRDPLEYYVEPRKKPGKPTLYHLTAKFCGGEHYPDYNAKILKHMHKEEELQMIGLFFTEKCFGIRVKLSQEQNEIFDGKTTENFGRGNRFTSQIPSPPLKGASGDGFNVDLGGLQEDHGAQKGNKSKPRRKKEELFYEGLKCLPLPKEEQSVSHQSRAHITIGVAPGVAPVETGNDLMDILDLENRSCVFQKDYEIPGLDGKVRQFGKEPSAFVVYPSHNILAKAVFKHFGS